MKIIRKIKPKLSLEPDSIATFAIKNLCQSIAYPLARFFESFMSVGQVRYEWKSAIVIPIFKKGHSFCLFQLPPCFPVLCHTKDYGKDNRDWDLDLPAQT